MHHQAVEELAPGLEVAATSPDGVIEAFEETTAARWWVGVQFHPEWMTQFNWALGLFTALIDASRSYTAVPRDEIETLLDEIRTMAAPARSSLERRFGSHSNDGPNAERGASSCIDAPEECRVGATCDQTQRNRCTMQRYGGGVSPYASQNEENKV